MTAPHPSPASPADIAAPRTLVEAGAPASLETTRTGGGIALASRGDALTEYLFAALQRRYPIAGRIDPELTQAQRLAVAGMTFRPGRSRWQERFYKSDAARTLRTRNGDRQLSRLPVAPDLVLQVHQLFDVADAPTAIYVDCTHRQSAEQWPDWNPLRGRALARWYEREQRAYDAAAHLFVFSSATHESLTRDYGIDPAKVTVVGAGVNFERLPEPAARRSGAPTVLFVGNDFIRKGGLVLLEAFRAVRARIPEARLVLAGALPPISPEPGVEILGRIADRARIEALYRDADVFTLPSYFEPFGIVLLEAMAFGLPVVATRQMGAPEIVEHDRTGHLVDVGDADQLADALLHALQHRDEAAAWGAAGRERVRQRFTWDAVVDRMSPALDAIGPR